MTPAFTALSLLSLSALAAHACEGPCIVQVTNAFVGNYTTPVKQVFADLATQLAHTLLPAHTPAAPLLAPLLAAFEKDAHAAMQQAIFPGFFHGKCQVNGVDPKGCPNPDCPVVCGTPGSMVHFYTILTHIAFNTTASTLAHVCAPSSSPSSSPHTHSPYHTLEAAVLQHRAPGLSPAQARTRLRAVLAGVGSGADLARACGGQKGLPRCTWAEGMKAYILSFP